MLFFLFGPQGVPGEVADQNEVHRKARPFGGVRRGPAGEEPVYADEFQHGAHHAHQRAAGDEARGDQRAAVEAGFVQTLVFRAAGDEPGHQSAHHQRGVQLHGDEHAQREGEGRIAQKTEDLVGPYELHDFFLYNFLRAGYGPAKILLLAEQAFDRSYDRAAILRWLTVFVRRFFTQQFKRSAMPDGPKVGSVTLSPRGDWRMPSDASAAAWLRELDML